MKEQDKTTEYFRMERDDCAMLLRRILYATRSGESFEKFLGSGLRDKAIKYLADHGLQGMIIRTTEVE